MDSRSERRPGGRRLRRSESEDEAGNADFNGISLRDTLYFREASLQPSVVSPLSNDHPAGTATAAASPLQRRRQRRRLSKSSPGCVLGSWRLAPGPPRLPLSNKTYQAGSDLMIDKFTQPVNNEDWLLTTERFYEHVSTECPSIFAPKSDVDQIQAEFDDNKINASLIRPVALMLCGQNVELENSQVSLTVLNKIAGLDTAGRRPGQLCGHVFKKGEATYSCKECASDNTCVLCDKCFRKSPHIRHKYKMFTSQGGGYCDCGDEEAWKKDYACLLHTKEPQPGDENLRLYSELPFILKDRLTRVCRIVLRYAIACLCHEDTEALPLFLKKVTNNELPYQTILFNDETHTYDAVIRALELAIHCNSNTAMLLATLVDREGRTSVKAGPKEICERVKNDIQRRTQKDSNRRTQKKGPLDVKVYDSSLVAHQMYASRLISWLTRQISNFPPLAEIIGNVLLHTVVDDSNELLLSPNSQESRKKRRKKRDDSEDYVLINSPDAMAESEQLSDLTIVSSSSSSRGNTPESSSSSDMDRVSLVVKMMTKDRRLWKAARLNFHQMLMATVLMDIEQKKLFSKQFIKLYKQLYNDYIDDDHDHGVSIVAMTVQFFTVTTVARELISVDDALKTVFEVLIEHCRGYVKVSQFNPDIQHLDFTSFGFPAVLKRALFILKDAEYLLTCVPKKNEWTDALRKGFVSGVTLFVDFLAMMQGMDEVRRQSVEHQLFESEWETGFNIQIRVQEATSLILAWACADAAVHRTVFNLVMKRVEPIARRHAEFSKKRELSLYEYRAHSYEFDVTKGVISIHQSLWRLLSGLFGAAPDVLSHVVVENAECDDGASMETDQDDATINLKGKRAMMMEMSLRVMVLSAQTAANLWRRNGFSLVNQIHNYFSPLCRSEMFDRDILALQVGASLTEPETFLIRLIDRFGLTRWADPTASEEQSAPATPTARAAPPTEETNRPMIVVNFGTNTGTHIRANITPAVPPVPQAPTITVEESSKIVVTMAEEFLHLLIIICMERYGPGVGLTSRKEMLKHEIIHLLCAGPMQFSKIDKVIPDDPLSDNIVLEQAVMEVGDFFKPSQSSAGVFTLKKELKKRYNAFYYHYSRSDISAAEQHQQKERAKEPLEIAACPPPMPPTFAPFFTSIPHLLKSPLLMRVLKLSLDRHSKRNRFSSDGLFHRVLFVLGMGLNEQERSMNTPDAEPFDFLTVAKEEGIREALQKLVGKQESHSHTNLLMWNIKKFDELEKRRNGAMEVDEKTETVSTDKVDSGVADKARRRAALAAKMRANAMGQMNRMAKTFMNQHKEIAAENGAEKSRSKKSVSFRDDDIEYSKISEDNKFPVCCGPEKTEIEHITPRRARCMLCQEEEEMNDTSKPIVCAAYVQESALFNQRGHAPLPNYGPVFVPITMDRGLDMSTCAHTMHYDCYITHTESLFARERNRPRNQMAVNQRMIDIEEREYQCPLCKRLSNCAIPLMPALKLLKLKGFSQDRPESHESFEDWLTNIADLITKPITAIGGLPTPHKPVKSHSRKRSHSERSLLDLVKSENREQKVSSLAEQSVLSTSVPSASTLSLLMSEGDPAAAARADAAVISTVEMVLGEGSAGEAGGRANSLSINDVDMADSASVTSGPSRADSTANILSLPSNLFNKIKCMLPTKLPKDNVPNNFAYWDMIKAFIKNLPAVQTSHQVTDNHKNYLEFATAIAGTTFVLRELSVILREESKPLFGAFNTRQRDCLNAVSRLAVLAPFNCRTAFLRLVVSRAFVPLLAVPDKYDHSLASWNGPVYPTTVAENPATVSFNLSYDAMDVPPYSPTSPQSPPHSTASSGSGSGIHRGITSPFAPPPSVSDTLMNQLKTNVSVHHVDMLSLAVELMMTIGYSWLDGRQVLHTHNRQDNMQKIANGSLDELYALRLTLLAHICQVMAGFKDGEAEHNFSEESDTDRALNARISELYRLACPGEELRDARRLRILLHEAIVEFLRPIAILYNSITLIPPPEALKDPSLDEFEPLLRYMGLSHHFIDLIDGQFVERLFANWGKYYPQVDRQLARPVQLPIRLNRLIDLPADITDVVNLAVNYKCPSVRVEELATSVPTMCLVCGAILCSQSYCCQQTIGKEAVGACTFHTKQCSGSGGIFLRLRDSQLLILANRSRGMLKPAPYVDEFGETDQGFRRGNPLHLNKELYAKIQQLWLHQRITEEVVSQYDINYRYVTMEWQHF